MVGGNAFPMCSSAMEVLRSKVCMMKSGTIMFTIIISSIINIGLIKVIIIFIGITEVILIFIGLIKVILICTGITEVKLCYTTPVSVRPTSQHKVFIPPSGVVSGTVVSPGESFEVASSPVRATDSPLCDPAIGTA